MRAARWTGVAITATAVMMGGLGFADERDEETRAARRGCTEATIRGAYGIQMQGTRPSGPGGPMETVVGVVLRVYDGHGGFHQIDNVKGSVSGIVPDREGSGTYEVSADCTAVTHFEPGPGISIEEKLVIVDGGGELFSIVLSPAPIMMATVQKRVRQH